VDDDEDEEEEDEEDASNRTLSCMCRNARSEFASIALASTLVKWRGNVVMSE
jgi:hypothetical protein